MDNPPHKRSVGDLVKRKITLPLTVLLSILAGASALAEAGPAWISGSSPDYPKGAYLTAVGEGATPEKAADKARSEIAKIFNVEIRSESQSSTREVTDGVNTTFSQNMSDEVSFRAGKRRGSRSSSAST